MSQYWSDDDVNYSSEMRGPDNAVRAAKLRQSMPSSRSDVIDWLEAHAEEFEGGRGDILLSETDLRHLVSLLKGSGA